MAELYLTPQLSDANLKAYYRFSSGAITTDSGPNGCTLTQVGSIGTGTGRWGEAADGGASNSTKALYVQSASLPDILKTSSASFFMWIKLQSEISSGVWRIFQMNNGAVNGHYFNIWYNYNAGNRYLSFEVGSSGVGPYARYDYTVTLGTSNWNHIGFTFTGSVVKAYFNTTNVGTTAAGSGDGNISPAKRLNILYDGSGSFASALIDDFCIFTDVLSTAEIAELYLASSPSSSISSSLSSSLSSSISSSISQSISSSISTSPSISISSSVSSSPSTSISSSVSSSISASLSPSVSTSPSVSSSLSSSPSISISSSPSISISSSVSDSVSSSISTSPSISSSLSASVSSSISVSPSPTAQAHYRDIGKPTGVYTSINKPTALYRDIKRPL